MILTDSDIITDSDTVLSTHVFVQPPPGSVQQEHTSASILAPLNVISLPLALAELASECDDAALLGNTAG